MMPAGEDQDRPLRIGLGGAWVDRLAGNDLAVGRVIELDCDADGDVDIFAGRRLVARGKAVAVDGKLGVRISHVEQDAG